VRRLANVRVEEGVTVQGLEFDAVGVTGVQFRSVGGEPTSLPADLVVDALGRGSSVADWLEQAGWPQAPVKTLDGKVTYVSRWYDLPTPRPAEWWWQHIVIMPTQDKDPSRPDEHSYLANFFPIDGNRAIACMGSWGLDMPKKPDDFAMSAKRLRTPFFSEAMERSMPTSEVHVTRSTGNKWRRYDQLPKMPERLVFVGDSICAFNPFYAQGMSSASMSAVLLKSALDQADRLDAGFAARFTREQVKILKVPWGMAMARDKGFDCATGTETAPRWRRRMMTWVGDKAFNAITGASREDAVVDEHFAKVFNLDESLGDMFRSPRVWYGLVRYNVRNALGRTTVPYGFDPLQDPPATDYTPTAAS
jgi:2-polyprenyl-6-methoxyphenol hydroxylase-like FAD-dependent oxidoreductase